MSPAYVGVGTVQLAVAGTAVAIPVPAGSVGDLLIAEVATSGTNITALSGWTDVPGVGHSATVLNPRVRVQYRFAVGDEGATQTWTIGSALASGIMKRYSNPNPTTPFDVNGTKWDATDATQTAIVVPTLTTITDGCLLISGAACNSNAVVHAQPATQGGQWTEVADLAGGLGKSCCAAYQPIAFAVGATGTMTVTLSGARSAFAWMIPLRPAPTSVPVFMRQYRARRN